MKRNQIFISYSHIDSDYLSRLRVHLRPFEREGLIDVWADTKINAGQRWKLEIEKALDRSAVAILLISADFLASDFVAENELPPLLHAAQNEGVKILPVILKPCAFIDMEQISEFQSINSPDNPVIALNESDRENIWYQVASFVKEELNNPKQIEAPELLSSIKDIPQQTEKETYSPEDYYGLYSEELRNPESINDFFIYSYHFIDELELMKSAELYLGNFSTYREVIKVLSTKLKSYGWEGDGNIQLMWLPPFIGAGIEDTHGVGVWHVKQSNNGTSFFASPVPLPFNRLLEQSN